MLKTMLLPLTLTASSLSYAACLPDSPEIGDSGPSSEMVCEMLETKHPGNQFEIIDRVIRAQDSVKVIVMVGDKPASMEYKLVGADWKLTQPNFLNPYLGSVK
jgi:hypothetical protein